MKICVISDYVISRSLGSAVKNCSNKNYKITKLQWEQCNTVLDRTSS